MPISGVIERIELIETMEQKKQANRRKATMPGELFCAPKQIDCECQVRVVPLEQPFDTNTLTMLFGKSGKD